jgi:2-haloalkanoic acid dehalogenase type II
VRPYDVLTFDCYGTLIDWESGISESITAAARADGIETDREQILSTHAEVEPQIQSDTYRSYREVLAEVALAIARRLEWPLKTERARFLPDGLPGWRVFPDTNRALQRLKQQGYRLGILSNVDDDLLAGTRRQFSVGFDFLVTAEQVRSYKPAQPRATSTTSNRRVRWDFPWSGSTESERSRTAPRVPRRRSATSLNL